ncbi:uncharacterized protein BO97DRAFT_427684 [Aspergillus homomorphus CBS 101889]|uniref:Uncharacterized protein n=1 Tax=Aspergillus homomorphus (strain CBS 101889) TaxID=1450537 RepID=A0A395HSJ7_ASPHC|nr:hypothetical protein BO97DRAFT_427684 [Aspergillus homomorphus CBS 101889]RAL09204.1 hypothetical protein BO97DRAFT_427684 [Aspergillus homomorphus CBS 101889]
MYTLSLLTTLTITLSLLGTSMAVPAVMEKPLAARINVVGSPVGPSVIGSVVAEWRGLCKGRESGDLSE